MPGPPSERAGNGRTGGGSLVPRVGRVKNDQGAGWASEDVGRKTASILPASEPTWPQIRYSRLQWDHQHLLDELIASIYSITQKISRRLRSSSVRRWS
jgi:hypothetical protein